jgi:hypothetical protein
LDFEPVFDFVLAVVFKVLVDVVEMPVDPGRFVLIAVQAWGKEGEINYLFNCSNVTYDS